MKYCGNKIFKGKRSLRIIKELIYRSVYNNITIKIINRHWSRKIQRRRTKNHMKSLKLLLNKLQQFNTYDDNKLITDNNSMWKLSKAIILYYYLFPTMKYFNRRGYIQIHYHEIFADSGLLKINNTIYSDASIIPLIKTDEESMKRLDLAFASVNYHIQDDINRITLHKKLLNHNKIDRTKINIDGTTWSEFVNYFESKVNDIAYTYNNTHVMLIDLPFDVSIKDIQRLVKSVASDILLRLPINMKEQDIQTFRSNIEEMELLSKNPYTIPINIKINNDTYPLLCITRSESVLSLFETLPEKMQELNNYFKQKDQNLFS